MSIRTKPWPTGVPCWADLTVPDVAAAKSFYAAVLGWGFQDRADDEHGDYSIAQVSDASAAGIGPLPQDGMRPAWTLYLASDDADKTAAAVTEHGGTVVLPPGDVGPTGRMFVASDPTGAVFGIWQAKQSIGAGVVNEPGGMVWEDLRSPDPDAARDFYTGIFGYRTETIEMAPSDYTTFALPGEDAPLGGIGPMMGAEGAPPHWLVYFGVSDADAAVTAVQDGGGSVLSAPFDTPYGRMAGLADPWGAVFWVARTDGSNQPDRTD